MNRGLLKHVISQNTDGLHRKSGIPKENLTEVHGNRNLEHCSKCGKDYMRDFNVGRRAKDHTTGRNCENPACKGALRDSIINFGQNLREEDINTGFGHGYKADLMLCLGSSMRVRPACTMAEVTAEKGGRLVIVNLQKTPMSPLGLHIHAKIDDVMVLLMKKLSIAIPKFQLKRYCKMSMDGDKLKVQGIDKSGSPFTTFNSALVDGKNCLNVSQ